MEGIHTYNLPQKRSISKPINIPTRNSFSNNLNKIENEYSLKENFFDPSKSSPPDNFIEKLEVRMQTYFNNSHNLSIKKEIVSLTK